MAALLMSRRSWADGYGFYCSIHRPGVSPVAPPACAPAVAPWEVCAALGMWAIPAGRVSSSVPLPGEPGKGRRVRHFRAKPFLRCEQRCPRPGCRDAQPSAALVPAVRRHIPAASLLSAAELLQSFCHGLCSSRAGCAPRSLLAKGLHRHLRPKIPVKSLCYLLFSVVSAAELILYLFFPLGALHFDASMHTSPCRGQQSRSASRAGWEPAAFGAYVWVSQGATALRWERFGGRGGSELWFAVFSGAKLLLGACWHGKMSRSCETLPVVLSWYGIDGSFCHDWCFVFQKACGRGLETLNTVFLKIWGRRRRDKYLLVRNKADVCF